MGSFTVIKPRSGKAQKKTGTGGTFTDLATGKVITKDPVPAAKTAGTGTGTGGPGQSPAPTKPSVGGGPGADPAAVSSSPSSLVRQYQEALGRGMQTAASPSRLLQTAPVSKAPDSSRYSLPRGLWDATKKGANQFAQAAADTLAMGEDLFFLPFELLAGEERGSSSDSGIFNTLQRNIRQEGEAMAEKSAENVSKGGKAAQLLDKYGTATVAAVPQAVLAMLTGGGSAAAQTSTALAQTAGKALSPSLSRTVSQTVSSMAKNPQYWTSFAHVLGSGYEQALADGAGPARAVLYAVGNGLMNAAVEISGGVQTMPGALQGGEKAWKALVDSALEEGNEEVIQGVIERGMQNLVYGKGNPLSSTTDPSAILNPRTALEEWTGGAVVGGVLGAGQTAVQSGVNAYAQNQIRKQLELMERAAGLRKDGPGETETGPGEGPGPSGGTDTTPGVNDVTGASEARQRQEAGNQLLELMRQVQQKREAEQQKAARADPLMEAARRGGRLEAQAEPETRISPYTDEEVGRIRREGRTFRNIIAGIDTSVSDFFNKWRHGRSVQKGEKLEKLYLGKMSLDTLQKVEDILGYDVDSRDFIVTNDDVKHILDRHGDAKAETEKGNVPLTQAIIDALPDIVANPDSIEPGKTEKRSPFRQGIVFKKILPDGTAVYIQFDNSGRGTFEGRTLYVKKGESPTSGLSVSQETGNFTSETTEPELSQEGASSPSADSTIAQGTEIVNPSEGEGSQAFVNPDAPVNDGLGNANRGFDDLSAAERIYGVLPEGENPVRPDDMPRQTTDENRVSRLARTIKGAEVVPDSFIPTLEQAVLDGKFSYIPHTNEQAAAKARETIEYNGWGKALSDFHRDVALGKAGDELTALGIELANNAANAGDVATALDVFIDLQQTVRNAGQAAQAVRMLKQASPAHRLYMIQRSVQSMVDSMNLPEGSVKLDEALLKNYLEADSEAQRDAVIREIQQSVADQIPSTLLDKWTALRYVNMLGNFRTQFRNVFGNVGMMGVRAAKDRVAAGLEGIYHLFNKDFERTKTFTVSKELKAAARADYENVADVALGQGKYQEGLSDDAFRRGVEENRTIFKNKFLEKYRTATNWAMTQGDVIFTRHTYARALAGYLKSHGVTAEQFSSEAWRAKNTAFVDKARMYAIQEAQEATFRDNNVVSDWVSGLGRGKKTPRPVRVLAEGLAPFRKTPANVLVRAEEYSPLGLANTIYEAVQAKQGKASGADVINSLSKSLTGTGLFIAGMLLAAGLVPGVRLRGGDDDDDKQRAFDNLTGHQAYSLELPNGYSVTLDWLTPGSMPLFMGVELQNQIEEDGFQLKDFEPALSSIMEPMIQMSMLQSVNDTLDNLKYSEDNLGQLAATLALDYLTQGLTNTLLGQAERTFEDVRQSTYTDKEGNLPTWLQREIGKSSAKTPGWDYQQMPYIDEWGREEETGEPAERAINNFFNPGYVSQVQIGSVEKELQRLKDATGDSTVLPNRVGKSIAAGEETKQLTADEYVQYARTTGQTRRKVLEQLMNSEGYRKLSDEGRAKAVQAAYEYADGVGKVAVSDWKPDSSHILSGIQKSMLPPAEYILYKQFSDRDGSGSTSQAESSQTLMEMDLTNEQRGQAWSAMNNKGETEEARARKEAKNPFTGAMAREGFDPEEALKFWQIYDGKGTKEDPYTKQEKQTDIMEALGLSSRMEAISLWNLMEKSVK